MTPMDTGYFDWAASSPISENALKRYLTCARRFYANPSAAHMAGMEAKQELSSCRKTIASLLRCAESQVFFTSGGTESDSIIMNSFLLSRNPGEILISNAEHSAVKQHARTLTALGWTVRFIPCPKGYVDSQALKCLLSPSTRLVALMLVNNILGTISDVQGAVRIIREHEKAIGRKIHIHTDAVQACGKIQTSFRTLGVDSMAIAAHKFCGPRGIGVLVNSNPAIQTLSSGGGQEGGLRPGTENLPAISAMTTALSDAIENLEPHHQMAFRLHRLAAESLAGFGFEILSPVTGAFSPYILNVSTRRIPSEVFVRMMSDKGFFISAGSACNNNSRKKAESLADLGFSPAQAACSVRLSWGFSSTEDELGRLCNAMGAAIR